MPCTYILLVLLHLSLLIFLCFQATEYRKVLLAYTIVSALLLLCNEHIEVVKVKGVMLKTEIDTRTIESLMLEETFYKEIPTGEI